MGNGTKLRADLPPRGPLDMCPVCVTRRALHLAFNSLFYNIREGPVSAADAELGVGVERHHRAARSWGRRVIASSSISLYFLVWM